MDLLCHSSQLSKALQGCLLGGRYSVELPVRSLVGLQGRLVVAVGPELCDGRRLQQGKTLAEASASMLAQAPSTCHSIRPPSARPQTQPQLWCKPQRP